MFGDIGDGRDVLVRLHREHILRDVFGGDRSLDRALARFAKLGRGVLVYLREGTAGVPHESLSGVEDSESARRREEQWREIGLGAQILRDLGVTSIRILASQVAHLCRPRRLRPGDRGDRAGVSAGRVARDGVTRERRNASGLPSSGQGAVCAVPLEAPRCSPTARGSASLPLFSRCW